VSKSGIYISWYKNWSILQLHPNDRRVHTSNKRLQTSNKRLQKSNRRLQTTTDDYRRLQTSNRRVNSLNTTTKQHFDGLFLIIIKLCNIFQNGDWWLQLWGM
jgi:hypothetical protein